MYKLIKRPDFNLIDAVQRLSDNACIPFDPANTDYANFKAQVLADVAELQDAEGAPMSKEQAQNYVKTLP